ncbi:hypothetical protein IHN63_00740 [Deinococcus sp. 6YEL10]|uniref:hypothetical protein n=1 Tax=Deinococcus sp. 6YEL10 TaxID=2745870 RepID=UPI001E491E46|nr:hypothetical protein [Deinococcus sp. 6YEL10]MCD0159824.1 hypothetical protein [Deinococcus sp. 6YEL10]
MPAFTVSTPTSKATARATTPHAAALMTARRDHGAGVTVTRHGPKAARTYQAFTADCQPIGDPYTVQDLNPCAEVCRIMEGMNYTVSPSGRAVYRHEIMTSAGRMEWSATDDGAAPHPYFFAARLHPETDEQRQNARAMTHSLALKINIFTATLPELLREVTATLYGYGIDA